MIILWNAYVFVWALLPQFTILYHEDVYHFWREIYCQDWTCVWLYFWDDLCVRVVASSSGLRREVDVDYVWLAGERCACGSEREDVAGCHWEPSVLRSLGLECGPLCRACVLGECTPCPLTLLGSLWIYVMLITQMEVPYLICIEDYEQTLILEEGPWVPPVKTAAVMLFLSLERLCDNRCAVVSRHFKSCGHAVCVFLS